MGVFRDISGFDNLTSKQKQAIILLCDYEQNLAYKEVADEVDISTRQLLNWRKKDETFIEVKNKALELGLENSLREINQSLVKGAKKGDPRLIKLYYERIGKYKDRKEITGADGGAIEIDAKNELAAAINRIAERKER